MKVKEIITKLSRYNPEADVIVSHESLMCGENEIEIWIGDDDTLEETDVVLLSPCVANKKESMS